MNYNIEKQKRAFLSDAASRGVVVTKEIVEEVLAADGTEAGLHSIRVFNKNVRANLSLTQILSVLEYRDDLTYRIFIASDGRIHVVDHENKYYNYIDKNRLVLSYEYGNFLSDCSIVFDYDVVIGEKDVGPLVAYAKTIHCTDRASEWLISKEELHDLREKTKLMVALREKKNEEAIEKRKKETDEYEGRERKKKILEEERRQTLLTKNGCIEIHDQDKEPRVRIDNERATIFKKAEEHNSRTGETERKLVELKYSIRLKSAKTEKFIPPVKWLRNDRNLEELFLPQVIWRFSPPDFHLIANHEQGILESIKRSKINEAAAALGYNKKYVIEHGVKEFMLEFKRHPHYPRVFFNGVFVRRGNLENFMKEVLDEDCGEDPIKTMSELGRKLEFFNFGFTKEQFNVLNKGRTIYLHNMVVDKLHFKIYFDRKTKLWTIESVEMGKTSAPFEWSKIKEALIDKCFYDGDDLFDTLHKLGFVEDVVELSQFFQRIIERQKAAKTAAKRLLEHTLEEHKTKVHAADVGGSSGLIVEGKNASYFIEFCDDGVSVFKNPTGDDKGIYLCIHNKESDLCMEDQAVSRVLLLLNDDNAKASVHTLK